MRILKLFLVVGVIAFLATDAFAQVAKGGTYPGMKVTGSPAICTVPHVTKDLIEVINNESMFFTYMEGYKISGYCGEMGFAGGSYMELLVKFPFKNVSYDGHRVEMWMVKMPEIDGVSETRFALILPDANIGGDKI